MSQHGFPKKITALALFMFFLAACFYFYEFIVQVSPGALSFNLMRDFGVTATKLGIMSSAFFFTYTLFQFPGGFVYDRFGGRLTLSVVVAIYAIGVLIFSVTHNFYMAVVARAIMGLGGAFAFVGVLYLAARWFPPRFYALFAGVAGFMGSIGAVIGSEPIVYVAKTIGWRQGFFYLSFIGFILALLIAIFVRNQSVEFIPDETEIYSLKKSVKAVLGSSQTWYNGIFSFCTWAPILAFSALWGVPFLEASFHLTNMQAGQAVAFSWLGVAIGSPFLGWLSDITKRRCLWMSLSAFLGLVTTVLVIYLPSLSATTVNGLLFLVGVAVGSQTIAFGVLNDINSPMTKSAATGFNNMAVVATGIVFQPIIGRMLDANWSGALKDGVRIYSVHSYHMAFLVLPICYVVAMIISMFFVKETRCKQLY